MSAAPYDLKLSAASSLYSYLPSRDAGFATAWNSSYTGETSWPVAGANAGTPAGIAYRGTNAARVSVSISFEGTGLFLCYKANGAGVALTLDNKLFDGTGDVSTLCADFKGEADAVLVATGLENTSHSALLQVSAGTVQEFRFFGGGITLAVPTNGKVVDTQIVDETDNGWTYSPNSGQLVWDKSFKGPTLVGGTGAFQCNYGAERRAAYSFSGASGVILHGLVWQDSHEFSVLLDTETVNMDASSSWGDGTAVFFARTGLDPTQSHTIALVDYNSDVPDCRAKYGGRFCCTGLDAITLLRAGTADLPPTTSSQPTGTNLPQNTGTSSSNVGAIAGGVVGGIIAALAILLLAWFILRRKRNNKDEPVHPSGGIGQPVLSDEHTSRPAFFSNAPTSYAPSMSNSGIGFANPGAQSMHRSDSHWAPAGDVGSIHQSVASLPPGAANAMSPSSMYSQQGIPPQMYEQQQQQQQTPSWLQPVVATGDRKVRHGIGAGGNGVVAAPPTGSQPSSLYAAQTNSSQPQLARSAGSNSSGAAPYGSAPVSEPGAPGGPRLAQEDLEQVLAFIAQRMDRVPGQPPTGPRSEDGDHLPEYRG